MIFASGSAKDPTCAKAPDRFLNDDRAMAGAMKKIQHQHVPKVGMLIFVLMSAEVSLYHTELTINVSGLFNHQH